MLQDSAANRLPGFAYAIAGLTVTSMIVWSFVQWPEMAPSIITREAAGNHGTSSVPRLISAGAMPMALILLTIFMGFAPRIDARYLKLLGDPGTAGPSSQKATPRVLGLILIGMSVLLGTLHVVIVGLYTPGELPTTSLIASAVGVFILVLSFAFPMITPRPVTGYEFEHRLRATQRRAYRTVAPLVMMVTAVAMIVAAWIAPNLALPIGISGVTIMFAGIAIAAVFRARRP